MNTPAPERYLRAKELAARLAEAGIEPCSYEYVLEVIRVAPTAVGRTMRFGDLVAFMAAAGPGFRPFARDPARRSEVVPKKPIQGELPGIMVL